MEIILLVLLLNPAPELKPSLVLPQSQAKWITKDSSNYELFYSIINEGDGGITDFNKTSYFIYATKKSKINPNNFIFEKCLIKQHNSGIKLNPTKGITLFFDDKIPKSEFEKIKFGMIVTKCSYTFLNKKETEYLFAIYKPNTNSIGHNFFTTKPNQREEALDFLRKNNLLNSKL